jgi:hypothetical protein
MCVTLIGLTIWGYTIGITQGCSEPLTFPKLEPPPPPVVSEGWFPFVDKSDLDPAHPDAGTVYLSKDGDLKRWASEDCRDTSPIIDATDEHSVKVRIRRTESKDTVEYSVKCKERSPVS